LKKGVQPLIDHLQVLYLSFFVPLCSFDN
jgi:hypothetical protein